MSVISIDFIPYKCMAYKCLSDNSQWFASKPAFDSGIHFTNDLKFLNNNSFKFSYFWLNEVLIDQCFNRFMV